MKLILFPYAENIIHVYEIKESEHKTIKHILSHEIEHYLTYDFNDPMLQEILKHYINDDKNSLIDYFYNTDFPTLGHSQLVDMTMTDEDEVLYSMKDAKKIYKDIMKENNESEKNRLERTIKELQQRLDEIK